MLPSNQPMMVVRGISVTLGMALSSPMTPWLQSKPDWPLISSFSLRSDPPRRDPSSARMTRLPWRAAASAAIRPVGPEPITSMSQWA